MYSNGANQSFNPYQPAYPTYLPQAASVPGQAAVQLPYIQQPARQPQPMPTQQIVNLAGRVVQNEQEITPQEVAMDGSISLFPLADILVLLPNSGTLMERLRLCVLSLRLSQLLMKLLSLLTLQRISISVWMNYSKL